MSVRQIVDGDYSFGRSKLNIIDNKEACFQTCKTRLMQLRGEWFLNYQDGISWGDVIGHKPNPVILSDLVKRELLAVNGVIKVESIDVDIDDRHVYIIAKLKTNFGVIDFNQSMNAMELLANDKTNK